MKQLLALLLVTPLAACGVDESAIKPWVKQHFPGATYECMSVDSDGDGYVSCTVFPPDDKPVPIECSAVMTPLTQGCRIARVGR